MERIDPVRERARLRERYRAMNDLELQKVGRDPEALTEWARAALQEEMEERALQWSPEAVSEKTMAMLEEERIVPLRTYSDRMVALAERSVLQNAGIETLFLDETAANPGQSRRSNQLAELKLMVRAKDFAAAQEFLDQKTVRNSAEEHSGGLPGGVTSLAAGKPMVLRVYRDMPAAFVDKSVLDAAGIRCYLQDANVVRMDWMWSNAVGGIKLVVSDVDAEDAAKILDSRPDELPAEPEW